MSEYDDVINDEGIFEEEDTYDPTGMKFAMLLFWQMYTISVYYVVSVDGRRETPAFDAPARAPAARAPSSSSAAPEG